MASKGGDRRATVGAACKIRISVARGGLARLFDETFGAMPSLRSRSRVRDAESAIATPIPIRWPHDVLGAPGPSNGPVEIRISHAESRMELRKSYLGGVHPDMGAVGAGTGWAGVRTVRIGWAGTGWAGMRDGRARRGTGGPGTRKAGFGIAIPNPAFRGKKPRSARQRLRTRPGARASSARSCRQGPIRRGCSTR